MADAEEVGLAELRELAAETGSAARQAKLRVLLGKRFSPWNWRAALERCAAEDEARRLRQYVQHTTLKALLEEEYCAPGGEVVRIDGDAAEHAPLNVRVHHAAPLLGPHARRYASTVKVEPASDVLEVSQAEERLRSRMVCVSYAAHETPGGQYRRGGAGGEEDLLRRSNMASVLSDPQGRFAELRRERGNGVAYPLGLPSAVFAPNVLVLRGTERLGYPLLMTQFKVHVVSVPSASLSVVTGGHLEQLGIFEQMRLLFTTCSFHNATWVLIPMRKGIACHFKTVLSEAGISGLFFRVWFCRPAEATDEEAAALAKEYNTFFPPSSAPFLPSAPSTSAAPPPRASPAVGSKRRAEGPVGGALEGEGELGGGLSSSDTARLSVRKRLCGILEKAAGEAPRVAQKAREVEEAMGAAFGPSTAEYRERYKMLVLCFGDKKNEALREDVLSGRLPCKTLVEMSAKELSNPERRAHIETVRKEVTEEMMAHNVPEQVTHMHTCRRCHKKRCSFYELQTRSGDEPMTQFIHCLNCGNNWKI